MWYDKTFSGTIKMTTIVLLFLISTSTLTSMVDAQRNSSTIQNQKGSTALGGNKSFYLFTDEMEGIDETKLGIHADYYIPNELDANEGDTVTIHFYNLDAGDRHTFTIGSPYYINEDAAPLHNVTFTFKAGNEGVYRFYCTYHQPNMTGQLIVLPSSTVLTNTASK
ncbi:MAG: cupredoxin domain-containing protein [Candidatus Nitrosopolaris sp.]